jgi:hypothetical protein
MKDGEEIGIWLSELGKFYGQQIPLVLKMTSSNTYFRLVGK